MNRYIALLLFETRVDGRLSSYCEEIHLIDADSLTEAEEQAAARGVAQQAEYDNSAGEGVEYRLLRVVDVQPWLSSDPAEAVYTRSFSDLHAYREVATLSGPLPGALTDPATLPALANSLQHLFGPPFHAEVQRDGIGLGWAGRSFGSVSCAGMEQQHSAWSALNAAHDVVLEGMGEDGLHPGPLVDAQCLAEVTPQGWLLRLLSPDGRELRRSIWHAGAPTAD